MMRCPRKGSKRLAQKFAKSSWRVPEGDRRSGKRDCIERDVEAALSLLTTGLAWVAWDVVSLGLTSPPPLPLPLPLAPLVFLAE